jgi:hypothetical protein
VSFSHRIRQCVCSSTIRFVPCAFFISKQFHTCANAFPNEFTVRSNEYCAGKHWILYWIQENKTATYFLRSRLFTYDIMKKFNSDSLYDFKEERSCIFARDIYFASSCSFSIEFWTCSDSEFFHFILFPPALSNCNEKVNIKFSTHNTFLGIIFIRYAQNRMNGKPNN